MWGNSMMQTWNQGKEWGVFDDVGCRCGSTGAPVAQLVSHPGELAGHASGHLWLPAAAASLPLSALAGSAPADR